MGEVLSTLRDKLKLSATDGLILLTETKYLLKNDATVEATYHSHKNEDGFLYLIYAEENIYG
jgi:hypothetical protein